MEKLDLVLLSVEDWQGLYVNGILFDQGHSIELERFIKVIIGREVFIEGFEDIYLELGDDNLDLDNYGNRFPEKLEEVIEYQKIKQK